MTPGGDADLGKHPAHWKGFARGSRQAGDGGLHVVQVFVPTGLIKDRPGPGVPELSSNAAWRQTATVSLALKIEKGNRGPSSFYVFDTPPQPSTH